MGAFAHGKIDAFLRGCALTAICLHFRSQVGAFAHGKIDAPYVDCEISVSQYPLSAAYCLGRITNALEGKWGIV